MRDNKSQAFYFIHLSLACMQQLTEFSLLEHIFLFHLNQEKQTEEKPQGLYGVLGESNLIFSYVKYKWNQERKDSDAVTAQHWEDLASSSDPAVEFLCSLARSFYFCVPTDLKIGCYHARTWELI